ncbi:polysaccharide deacetylase family protein [Pseudobythopirellula maris]|uniref:polysaccharide deacetylase family protein n=1 Tax=Pseudobythopirellula maris TaxID=2527991 RepID=UPI0018D31F5C|nr:polysaccharide deacetylase family protein [Pseudobythopirellula maris]
MTVDTEEDDAWSGGYPPSGQSVRNIERLPKLQQLCDRHGVRPTYLVNSPVIDDATSRSVLQTLHAEGRCEIGAHLHAWCDGPHDRDSYDDRTSYLCNLSEPIQRAKIERLTDKIASVFGAAPVSFRAGRYGIDHVGLKLLAEFGYTIDSSVLAFRACGDHGPDYRDCPWQPYRVSECDIRMASDEGLIWEAPVSVGYTRGEQEAAHRLFERLNHPLPRVLKAPSIARRLGVAAQVKCSPEQSTATEIIQLFEAYRAAGAETLVVLLHSSSLMPGGSPYARNESEAAEILARVDRVLTHCLSFEGVKGVTLAQLATSLEAQRCAA